MFNQEELLTNLSVKMDHAIQFLKKELMGLRTNRSSVHLLDPLSVDTYGTKMPISQVATVSTPDPKTISIQVWDKSMVKPLEKAISDANLGIVPSVNGQIIRLSMPDLNEDRRKELSKLAYKYDEHAKISIRNVRRSGGEEIKAQEKSKTISEDEMHRLLDKVQKLTDKYVESADTITKAKEKEIMQV